MLLISNNDQTATILRPLTSVSVISAIISSSLNTLMSKSSDPTSSCGCKIPAIKTSKKYNNYINNTCALF